MARVTQFGLSGVVGTVVEYTMNGKQYVRSKPRKRKKGKQLPVNLIFGEVTRNGSPMVNLVKKYGDLLFPFSLYTYNNMRGWIRNLTAANPAEWKLAVRPNFIGNMNPAADIRDFMNVNIEISNTNGIITVSIPEINPAQDIKQVAEAKKINLKVIAVTSPYEGRIAIDYAIGSYSFDNKNIAVPAAAFELSFKNYPVKPGNMAIVIIALEFMNATSKVISDPGYLPAAGIAMGRIGDG